MKTTGIIARAVLIVASGMAPHVALAQQTGFNRIATCVVEKGEPLFTVVK